MLNESQTIDRCRFPLAILVVVLHAYSVSGGYVSIALSHVLAHIAVPCFFFISGYLFFYRIEHWDFSIYKNKIRKRIKTLLIPYVIWISLFILWELSKALLLRNGVYSLPLKGHNTDIISWIRLYWDCIENNTPIIGWFGISFRDTMPYLFPMWYIRDLIIAVLLTPLIFFLLKPRNTRIVSLLLLGFLFFSFISNFFVHCVPGLSIISLFPFCTGAFFSINNVSFIKTFRNIFMFGGAVVAIGLLILEILFDGRFSTTGSYIYPFWLIFGIIAFVTMLSLIPRKNIKISDMLSRSTFFVFAFHPFVLAYCSSFCDLCLHKIFGFGSLIGLVSYVLTPIFCVFICVLVYLLLERFLPSLNKILNGR